MQKATPTGATHEVGVEQIFFSTTDDRGVITAANDIFIDLSRYPREALIGAPHNIVRHPEMPRGVFHIMWERLQGGAPFAGYVRNLGADGSSYLVFATVTPLPDGGYVSVRTRPMCADVVETVDSLYLDVVAYERELESQGTAARTIAEMGARKFAELLADAGFDGYAEFQREMLPAEVAAREGAVSVLPDAAGSLGELADVDAAVRSIFSELDASMEAQDDLVDLSRSLKRSGRRIRHDVDTAAEITKRLDEVMEEDPTHSAEMMPIRVWSQMRDIAARYTGKLLASLDEFNEIGAETRFRVALARLQTTELATFVTEVAEGGSRSHHAAEAIGPLCDVLTGAVEAMDEQTRLHRSRAAEIASYIDGVMRIMEIPQEVAVGWTASVPSMGLTGEAATLAASMTGAIASAGTAIGELDALRERCRGIGSTEESGRMREFIAVVRDHAAAEAAESAEADDAETAGAMEAVAANTESETPEEHELVSSGAAR